jgi:hypothetical protein
MIVVSLVAGLILAASGVAQAVSTFTTPEEIGGVPLPPVVNPITLTELRATATFVQDGNTLTVTLQNRSGIALGGSDVLGAVYFNMTGNSIVWSLTNTINGAATAESILRGNLSSYYNDPVLGPTVRSYIANNNVAPEWAYRGDLALTLPSLPNAMGDMFASYKGPVQYGISSVGLGTDDVDMFGPKNRFDKTVVAIGPPKVTIDLDQPASPDGPSYGIVSDYGTANPALNVWPFVQDTATFTFTLAGWDTATFTDVWFQFGTDLDEPQLVGYVPGVGGEEKPPIPEPVTLAGVCLGLCGLAGYVRKRR